MTEDINVYIFFPFQANLFKKVEPTTEEYVLLSLELLYLWNALAQCGEMSLRKMLIGMCLCQAIDYATIVPRSSIDPTMRKIHREELKRKCLTVNLVQ